MNFLKTAHDQKKVAVVVATLSCFMGPFMQSSVVVALPAIGLEFQMRPLLLGWISTSFLLAAAPFMIPFGRLGDIYGRRKIFTAGLVVLLLATLFIALSHSGAMIIACRALQGLSSAMIFSTVFPMLVSAVPLRERGQVLGIATAATYIGLSIGPFLGGIITHHLGWRLIFWFNLMMCITLLAITLFLFKGEKEETTGERFDLAGAILLGLGILATMYGFSNLPSLQAALTLAAGIGTIICFVLFELRISSPLVDIKLFRHNAAFAFSNLAALINYAATFAVTFLLSLYLQNVKALTSESAGLVLVAQPIIMALCSPLSGKLSDRIEPRVLASWGMACTLLGLAMLIFLDAHSTIAYVVVCLMILGFGFGLFSSPNTNAVMSSVERHAYGVASATLSTMRQTGMTFSMGIVMMVMSLILGRGAITPENPGLFLASMKLSFGIFALMCFLGIFASLARGNIKRTRRS